MGEDLSTRENARQEVPAPLRREVRLLGEQLGRVLDESGPAGLLEDVEQLRRTVIAARGSEAEERAAEALVGSWTVDRAQEVAGAFTCYFQLVNLAEERHRARALRQRDRGDRPAGESLAAAVDEVRSSQGESRLRALLADLKVQPVLTAHPTEARRRAVVAALTRVGSQLDRLEAADDSGLEATDASRRLLEEIETLWRTRQLRSTQVHPLDEVRTVMAVFDDSLFRVVPDIYRSLDRALGPDDSGSRPPLAPAFLRFGSWVGGDRDGNPAVTAAVTLAAMEIQAEHILLGYEAAATRIGRALTADSASTPPASELVEWLAAGLRDDPSGMSEIKSRSPSEPHRQALLRVADRVRATRLGAHDPYRGPAQLLDDLRLVQASLASSGARRLAFGELQHLVWQVETFGFHLAELEVRQHSLVLERALADVRAGGSRSAETVEVLATLAAMRAIQERRGPEACSRLVVSFTRDERDIVNAYALASIAWENSEPELDVVPLFETSADLERATAVLDAMLDNHHVRRRLKGNGRIEVMLGYSDSTKEVGPASATLALYRTQTRLVNWARERGVRVTIFHGRGGAMGRGGGPANRAIRAQAPGSIDGHFKVTEQGEVIFARYASLPIARRHLEQVASAVLISSSPEVEARTEAAASRFEELAGKVDAPARAAYRALVESEGFEEWLARVSPIEELGRLRLGSRPSRRGGGHRLEDLRAIPWVFAWSQMRLNLPGWYGLGTGLAAGDLEELRRAYAEWPLFNSLLDNAEMSLAKTDRHIAERYLALGERSDLTARVLEEYDRTIALVLAVTGHGRLLENRRVLSWAVELRNPYVDALSHIQLRALRQLRQEQLDETDRERLEQLLLLTVNGVAAGLQNTG